MSDYQQFLAERDKIDFFINKGFRIKDVEENLEGAFLLLENRTNQEKPQEETLHIKHADSRKYFTSILIQQLQREK
ncbi:hypothetical protein [Sutcliffiella halmapala]|uniref:hypothetical protein n=1 Tax=Sutcliffiella halmapala TaxID=79882 RepID=UPI00099537A3|nr:hypothetical protein [Sutcliffiella halmapala]